MQIRATPFESRRGHKNQRTSPSSGPLISDSLSLSVGGAFGEAPLTAAARSWFADPLTLIPRPLWHSPHWLFGAPRNSWAYAIMCWPWVVIETALRTLFASPLAAFRAFLRSFFSRGRCAVLRERAAVRYAAHQRPNLCSRGELVGEASSFAARTIDLRCIRPVS